MASGSVTLSPVLDEKALGGSMKLRNLPKPTQLIRWSSRDMTLEIFRVLFCLLREVGGKVGRVTEKIRVPECF